MTRLMMLAVTACAVVGLAAGRLLVGPPKQDVSSLDELLQQSDPYENDIFSESQPKGAPRAPPRPSPTQHLLENLSLPRYIDASEFRRLEVLPPSLDINRQLTLLSASKRIRPPVDYVQQAPVLTEENSGTVYFPNTSPLFREDFPVEQTPDEQENERESSVAEETVKGTDEEPRISTSVSVSTSVSYSNEGSSVLDSEISTDSPTTDPQATASPTTTEQPGESPSTTTQSTAPVATSSAPSELFVSTTATADTPISSTQVADVEVVLHPEGAADPKRLGRQLAYEAVADYPDYPDYPDYGAMAPLSPLAHILGGFGSEFDSYGGDFGRSEFISSFRPVDF